MIALARAVVEAGPGGRPRYSTLRSAPPLVLRPTPWGLHLVSGAAWPLGGDHVRLELVVGAGARLVVRSVGATLARPGAMAAGSSLTIAAEVAAGARLEWWPEPTLAAAGSRHRVTTVLSLEPGCSVVWMEELVLGRHHEACGSWSSTLQADLGHRPLLRHRLDFGPGTPGWTTPAVVGQARAVGSALVVDPAWSTCPARNWPAIECGASGRVVAMALAGPAVGVSALAPTGLDLRRLLDRALAIVAPGHGHDDREERARRGEGRRPTSRPGRQPPAGTNGAASWSTAPVRTGSP